jgi:hypothetical protein
MTSVEGERNTPSHRPLILGSSCQDGENWAPSFKGKWLGGWGFMVISGEDCGHTIYLHIYIYKYVIEN